MVNIHYCKKIISNVSSVETSTQQQGHGQAEETLPFRVVIHLMPSSDPIQTSMLCRDLRRSSWGQYHLFGFDSITRRPPWNHLDTSA
ncbi:hypothetical protein TNCV_107491 [Trichonephila clavipes]|nr:hypothetical protein TNCV_107491 [Trichonephila clavipes]